MIFSKNKEIKTYLKKRLFLYLFACLVLVIVTAPAQLKGQGFVFNSSSTGKNNAFPPTSVPPGTTDITLDLSNGKVTFLPINTFITLPNTPLEGFKDGVFNFTTFDLPSGITMTFIKHSSNPPVTILSTGDITIDGTIDISGKPGELFKSIGLISRGGEGGPGGFNGGNGGAIGLTNNIGGAGFGPGGGKPGNVNVKTSGGIYGAANDFVALIPLFGGSGGGGGFGDSITTGSGGGGGGGAILLASSTTIIINGTINANGGEGARCKKGGGADIIGNGGGGGSGGAIRIVAKTINGTGSLTSRAGIVDNNACANPGSVGRIRLEAFTQLFNGTVDPAPSMVISPGPVSVTSNPGLTGLPSLTISSVAGVNVPTLRTSSLSSPDLVLPQGSIGPVNVIITTKNIPVDTIFTVRVTPQFGDPVDVSSTASTDGVNPGEAIATAMVNLPIGEIAILSAFADFTIQTASNSLLNKGEKIDRVLVATNLGEKSQLSFLTKSGQIIKGE